MGGKFLLKLNIYGRPIANKYREGKMKRTLKRELKVLEIVKREGMETSDALVILLRAKVGRSYNFGVSASVWSGGESLGCGKVFRDLKRSCSTSG